METIYNAIGSKSYKNLLADPKARISSPFLCIPMLPR